MTLTWITSAIGLFFLISCGDPPRRDAPSEPRWASGEPPVFVRAAGETVVPKNPQVSADDPALWADINDPTRAVMFGTDKALGLYVHNLDGSVRQFLPGPVNNVDLRGGFPVDGRDWVLVAATHKRDKGLKTYLFDSVTLETMEWRFIPIAADELYGLCMGRRGDDFYLVATTKVGTVYQWRIEAGASGPVTTLERTLQLGSQSEGCVVDDVADALYVGEEDVALWRFDFDPLGSSEPTRIGAVDGQHISADIEGIALLRDRGLSYLIVSSQGDDTLAVFRIEGEEHIYLGRFAVIDSETVDGVVKTDGIDAWSGPIGEYPEGLVALHDHQDTPGDRQQNYKFVDWRDIRRAIKHRSSTLKPRSAIHLGPRPIIRTLHRTTP